MQGLKGFIQEHRNLSIAIGGILAVALIGCCLIAVFAGGGEQAAPEETTATAVEESHEPAEPTAATEPTDTSVPTDTPVPTETPIPTDTPVPTETPTPEPTNTPRPTDTPVPPTPTPEPIVLSGSGDSVVNVEKGTDPALAQITYNGGSNFIVENYGADGEQIELLVNTIGSYEGTRPLDFMANETTTRFQIKASGPWEIRIVPLAEGRRMDVPGSAQGTGDDVLLLVGETPDLLQADASNATSNFIVLGYDGGRDLLVNEIAPYSGTVMLNPQTIVLEIVATGPWTIEVTGQ